MLKRARYLHAFLPALASSARSLLVTTVTVLLLVVPAHAKDYTGPIKVLIGFPAGGATDYLARLMADRMRPVLGQPVIIENKPGAGGMIAAQLLKNAPSDGSVVMLGLDLSMVTLPLTMKSPGFDPLADFTPIAGVSTYRNVLAVSSGIGVSNLKEFSAWARKNPDKAFLGIPAPAKVSEVITFTLSRSLQKELTTVPYRGSAALVLAVLANEAPAGYSSLSEYIEHHKTGKLKILASSGTNRPETARDIPTFAEQGVPGFEINPWSAFVGPRNMPPEFVKRFAEAVSVALSDPEVKEKLLNRGNATAPAGSEEVRTWFVRSHKYWSDAVRNSGVHLE